MIAVVKDGDAPLSLFEGFGIELEYMVVERNSGDVLAVTDQVLQREAGEMVSSIEEGEIGWSNELVLHVIELKTNGPAPALAGLPQKFLKDIGRINDHLSGLNGCLMPTAMHPWMDPDRETRLWPHENNEIYAAYNGIFDCRGHGWANLQSMHINLPFAGDDEFFRLHTAIRTLLPVMPALAASSPFMQWELTGLMDTRLETYRHNADRIPAITGQVVPEPVRSREEYQRLILEPMYAAIAPYDPEKILQEEWLNSRGAIARFDRSAIEIRVLDTQETPGADIAVACAIISVLKALSQPQWSEPGTQAELATASLAAILLDVIRAGDEAVIRSNEYLNLFRFPESSCRAGELWQYLSESVADPPFVNAGWRQILDFILKEGCLARRLVRAVGPGGRRSHIREAVRVLCRCLADGVLFEGI